MSTLHYDHAGHGFVYLKGAPERVLDMCMYQRMRGEDLPLDRIYWANFMDLLASRGQRLLAIAFKVAAPGQESLKFADVESGLTLLGIVGIIDPPREAAIAAVRTSQAAGIRVKMITGDHAITASAIGSQMDTAIFENLEQHRLRQVLGRSVDPNVMEKLLNNPNVDFLKGERAVLTGEQHLGASQALGLVVDDHEVIVVGEVPMKTLRWFASRLRSVKP